MATLTKRSQGQWQAKIRKKGYPAQSKTFRTKASAEQWARLVESEMDRSVFVSTGEAENTSLTTAAERYFQEVSSSKKSKDDARSRLSTLKKHLGHLTLASLTPRVVRDYRDYRLQLVSGDSVRKELSILGRLLKHAQQEWEINLPRGNPVDAIAMPQKARARDRRLEPGEEAKLLVAAKAYGGAIADIIELAIETGMRRGEIVSLDWKHINFSNQTARLPDTKNGESREIPLSKKAMSVLKKQPRNLTGPVFMCRGDSVTQAFTRVRNRAGITDLRFHDLRHEATSRFFELGLGMMEVAAITGHKDLTMLKRYTHLRAADLARKLK